VVCGRQTFGTFQTPPGKQDAPNTIEKPRRKSERPLAKQTRVPQLKSGTGLGNRRSVSALFVPLKVCNVRFPRSAMEFFFSDGYLQRRRRVLLGAVWIQTAPLRVSDGGELVQRCEFPDPSVIAGVPVLSDMRRCHPFRETVLGFELSFLCLSPFLPRRAILMTVGLLSETSTPPR